MSVGNAEAGCDRINPFRRAFDFGEVADWGLVDDHVAGAVTPLAAELLIGEARLEAGGGKNGGQGLAVFDLRFDFPARFVPAWLRSAFVFVGHRPLLAVLADAQQSAAPAQRTAG